MHLQTHKPDYSRLYGVTHDVATNEAVIRTPRTIKVSIGILAGKHIHAYISPKTGKWEVDLGGKFHPFETKEEARKFYRMNREKAPDRNYPTKLPYFTFNKVAPDGGLEPDWDSIERHGPTPTELDIVFTDDAPLQHAYEFWAKSGIQCRGNGIDAERICTMARTEEEKALAKQATDAGLKFFPIIGGCFLRGCPFAKPAIKNGKEYRQCGIHARLSFQLLNDIRLGGKASYDTTGYRSTAQLFSSIQELTTFTGNGDPTRGFIKGIPLRLVLRPFKTNHNGVAGKAYGVSLEFRAESVHGMRQKLLAFANEFGGAFGSAPQIAAPAAPAMKQIEAPAEVDEPEVVAVEEPEYTEADAEVMNAEFAAGEWEDAPADDPDDIGDPSDQPTPTPAQEAAEKTQAVQDNLRERLKAAAPAPAPAPAPARRRAAPKASDAEDFGAPAAAPAPSVPQGGFFGND